VRVSSVLAFVARYASAAAAAWVVFLVEGVLLYAGLLVVALVFDQDAGGPLAGPLLVALAAALGIPLTALVCVPAVVLGALVGKDRHWSITPLATLGTTALLLGLYVAGTAWISPRPMVDAVAAWLVALLAVILPTMTCMTVAHGSRRLVARLAGRRADTVTAGGAVRRG